MKILCVDDDREILQLLERVLQSAGHDTVGCASGGEAIARLVSGSFDLIVTDMMLPDLRGADIIRAAKAQAPAMPAIGISANQDPNVMREFVDAGVGRFLPKPFRMADLLAEVRLVEGLAGRLRILAAGSIADESAFVRSLREEGFVVLPAPDLATFDAATSGYPIDVIVAAAGAAPGADEALAVRKLRADPASLLVVVVIGAESDEDSLLRRGASLCLSRPLEPGPLASLLHFALAPRRYL